jgi:hypothetical protein
MRTVSEGDGKYRLRANPHPSRSLRTSLRVVGRRWPQRVRRRKRCRAVRCRRSLHRRDSSRLWRPRTPQKDHSPGVRPGLPGECRTIVSLPIDVPLVVGPQRMQRRCARKHQMRADCMPPRHPGTSWAFSGLFSTRESPQNVDYNAMSLVHNNLFREARAGIEPANSGFADRCLTTWLPRQNVLRLTNLAPSYVAATALLGQAGGQFGTEF